MEHAEGAEGPVELRGLVDVTVREPVFDLYCGDRVRIFGRLYKPPVPSNPGQFDWALAKRRQGIHAGLTCVAGAGPVSIIGLMTMTVPPRRRRSINSRIRRG